MSEDATLDTFAGDGEERAGEDGERDAEPEPEAGDDEAGATDHPEPPSLTYTSSPDGDACAECGETVKNRWRAGEGAEDPDALVCPDCKTW
jgi:hypothetical protein